MFVINMIVDNDNDGDCEDGANHLLAVQMMMMTILLQSIINLFCSIHQLYFVKPGVFIDKEESEENEKWTDRALMLEYGRINTIEIEEEQYGRFIQRIRARCFPSPSPILPPGMAQISTTSGLPGEQQEGSIPTREPPVSWS